MHRKLSPLLLFLLLAVSGPVSAQVEKSLYKMGLVLNDDDKRHAGDVLNAATDAFVAARRFTMVERKQLNAVFTEKDLQEFIGGQINNKLSDVLGLDLLGVVDYTIETTRTLNGKPVTGWIIDVRLLDVKTAAVLATLTSNRPSLLEPPTSPRQAGELLFQGIREAFPPLGYVVNIAGKSVVVDLGSEVGLQDGDTLEIVEEGAEIIHPVTGQVLTAPMAVIGELKVVSTSPQISTCKIKSVKGELRLASKVRLKGSNSFFSKWIEKIPRIKRGVENNTPEGYR